MSSNIPALYQPQLDFARRVTPSKQYIPTSGGCVVKFEIKFNPATRVTEETLNGKQFSVKDLLPNATWQEKRVHIYRRNEHTDKSEANRALAELMESYEPYIIYIANKRWWKAFKIGGDAGLKDIISAGKEGLIISIRKWNPKMKPLSHLASVWISRNCQQQVSTLRNASFTIPARITGMCHQYNNAANGENPTDGEKFLKSAKCRDETRNIIKSLAPSIAHNVVSLDAKVGNDDNGPTVQETLACGDQGSADFEFTDTIETLCHVVSTICTSSERLILYLCTHGIPVDVIGEVYTRKGEKIEIPVGHNNFTLEQIGAVIGVTRERIRQIRDVTLDRIKAELMKYGISKDVLAIA